MSEQFKVAIVRGLYQAIGALGATTLATFAASSDWTTSLVAGGMAFFSALGFRGAWEGAVDTRRAASK